MAEPASTSIPVITVLMPVYNGERYLAEAVESVLAQTFGDVELIVIDDGSTDGTRDVMTAFTDERIRYVRHDVNRGLSAVLNEGISLSRTPLIARMDADDRMRKDRLQRQYDFLQAHPDIALVASFVDLINADGERTGEWNTDRSASSESAIRNLMPRTNCIAHSTVMMRRAALNGLRYEGKHEDWDLWLRLLAHGERLAKIPEPLMELRMHGTSYMGIAKKAHSLERRLLSSRAFFLRRNWLRSPFGTVQRAVIRAQARTVARHLRDNVITPLARDAYRLLTYSPVALLREKRSLQKALAEWKGRHVFVFSYLSTGGAEQVHADIMATVVDQHPLIIITGFSKDRAFAKRFAELGTLVEIPRLVHHPFTAKAARNTIVAAINERTDPVLFGANTDHFFAWLPLLKSGTKAIQLIHAFLYQPAGNVKHKAWLALFARIDRYVFVSRQAMADFEAFLFANNIPRSAFHKLGFIPNAVSRSGHVLAHERTGLLFVGRPSPEKRLDVFLDLTDRLEAKYPGRFRFTVVGAEEVEGHGHVAFKGTVNDPARMSALYDEHDLLALTSSREGFPMVVMEAMANGLVVLATPVGDVPNRLDPAFAVITTSVEKGVVVQEMFASVVALDGDRERMQRMKTAALERAQQEFDAGRFRERYRALLMSPAS